jgi:hypothetical protein
MTFITHVEWRWNPVMRMYDCIPHYRMSRSTIYMPQKQNPDQEVQPSRKPEVPGEDSYTHGGSGEPPTVDPEVQALIDSGVPLEVGGDNKLREVKTDKNA